MSPVISNVHDPHWNGRNEHGRGSHGSPDYMSWKKLLVGLLMLLAMASIFYLPMFMGDNGVLQGYRGKVPSVTLPPWVREIGTRAINGEEELHKLTLPEKVTRLQERALADFPGLERVIIPASVTEIGPDLLKGSEQAVIFCERDSCAHRYAEEWGYPYELID